MPSERDKASENPYEAPSYGDLASDRDSSANTILAFVKRYPMQIFFVLALYAAWVWWTLRALSKLGDL